MKTRKRNSRDVILELSDCTLEGRASTSSMAVGVVPTMPTVIVIPVGPSSMQVPTAVGNPESWGLPAFQSPGFTPSTGDLMELPQERPPGDIPPAQPPLL